MNASDNRLSAALYILIILIWGTTWIALVPQVENVSPAVSLTYRFMIAAPVMMGWALWRNEPLRFSLRNHLLFAGLGISLFSVNFLLFYHAAQFITSGLLAVVFSSASLMNTLNAALFLRTGMSSRHILGGLFGISGLALVFWPEVARMEQGSQVYLGLALCLAGTLSFSLGNMISSRAQSSGIPLIPAIAWGMVYGWAGLLIYSLFTGAEFVFDYRPVYILSLLYLSLIGSVAAFITYLTLLGRIGPSMAAYTTVLFPIVALIISTFAEDYVWSLSALAGLALVLAGNSIMTNGKSAS